MMEKTNEMIEKMGNLNVTLNIELNDKVLMLLWLKLLKDIPKDAKDVFVKREITSTIEKLAEEFDLNTDADNQSKVSIDADRIKGGNLVVSGKSEYDKDVKEFLEKYHNVAQEVAKYVEGHQWKGKYADIIRKASEKYGLSQKLLACMIQTLSGFDPKAEFPRAGLKGLMMLPDEIIKNSNIDPFDPEQNIMTGASYLYFLCIEYKWDLRKALAAYYAGREVVNRGNLPKEVRHFVDVVLEAMMWT